MTKFEEHFKQAPQCTASAPGRLEILGNHTDYNQGFVLSCAVTQRTKISLAPASRDSNCQIYSESFPNDKCCFSIDGNLVDSNSKSFCRYAQGVVSGLLKHDIDIPPFNAFVSSELPIAAGMSSSASFEIALISGLLHLADAELPPMEIAKIGQQAESLAVGANTGLMDQISICLGRKDHLIRSEYRECSGFTLPMPSNYAFVVIDSAETHDLSLEYNDRREQCEQATVTLASLETNVIALRDVTSQMLDEHAHALGNNLPVARHVVEENQRVLEAERCLADGQIEQLGKLLFDSHESSRVQFKNSSEALDRLIDLARNDSRCLGARLSGGGFGGITIHLVHQDFAEDYGHEMSARAEEQDGQKHWHTVVKIGDGPELIKH